MLKTAQSGSESTATAEQSESNNTKAVSKRRVANLLGPRRENITNDHIDDYDYINADGEKIRKELRPDGEGGTNEIEVNLTALLQTTPSTTSSLDIIRIEAQLVDGGKTDINPHIPSTDAVLEAAKERIAEDGLTPAWEVVDQ